MMDTTDRRLIADMQFGFEAGKDLDEEERKTAQQTVTENVRVTLAAFGCVVAEDINRLGCTGVAKMCPADPVKAVQELRIDLAGGGVGLPCFVPPTLFCLGHNTIGGLEDKQKQYHAEHVPTISRALTPEEEAKVAATDRVRRMKRTDAEEFIAGRSAAEAEEERLWDATAGDGLDEESSRGYDIWARDRGRVLAAIAGVGEIGIQRATLLRTVRMESTFLETILNTLREERSITKAHSADRGEVYTVTPVGAVEAVRATSRSGAESFQATCAIPPAWKCEEHTKTDWGCRHCIAQAVVEGSLEPTYVVLMSTTAASDVDVDVDAAASDTDTTASAAPAEGPIGEVAGVDVPGYIEDLNEAGCDRIGLFVRVATFTRKLSRD